MSSIKEQGDLFWTLTHQVTQSGILTRFFSKFVVVRYFTSDSNLLQPTEGVNRTPSHVTFSRICMRSFQCRTWHWLKTVVRIVSSMFHVLVRLDSLRLSTLHSSPSLSSSFSILLIFIFIFHVNRFGEKYLVRFCE